MKNTLNLAFFVFLGLALHPFGSQGQQNSLTFFVSPTGNNASPGTLSSPFGGLDGAMKAIAGIQGPANITVNIRGGNYHLAQSLILSQRSQDSSKQITFTNYNGEKVILSGGVQVANGAIHLVSEPAILNRLPAVAHGKVYECNLTAQGMKDFGRDIPYGYKNFFPSSSELFYNGAPLTVARWPNTGLAPIGKVLDPGSNVRKGEKDNRGAQFTVDDPRIQKWVTADNAWVGGFFSYGYSDDYMRVASVDPVNKVLKLQDPALYTVFSTADVSDGQLQNGQSKRGFYIYNLLEELDTPGEWYLDKKSGELYFWPPDGQFNTADIEVSALSDPIVVLSSTHHVTFKGITFAYGCGMGLFLDKTSHTSLINCNFEDLGTVGLSTSNQVTDKKINYQAITGVNPTAAYNTNLLIQSCTIFNTGTGGVILDGGDRRNLIPAVNVIDNCEIYNYSRRDKTYAPGIFLNGVGNQITHCYIHTAEEKAIGFFGNDHKIFYNHIRNVGTMMTDGGTVGTGRDMSSTGTEISYNFFDSLVSPTNSSMCAIYLDDGTQGITVNSNVFYKAVVPGNYHFGAININGGANNHFNGNYFIDCAQAFSNYQWSDKQWKAFVTDPNIIYNYYKAVDIRSNVYVQKYPELAKLADSVNLALRQNFITNSLAYNVPLFSTGASLVVTNTYTTMTDPGFVNAPGDNFTLTQSPAALKQASGWKPIPFSEIGIKR